MDFLHDNEILYNKHLMDYKDRSKREAVWDKFCEENNMDNDACQKWFQSQRTLFGKVTHMMSGQGELQLTERQKLTRDNFNLLRDHILRHITVKSKFMVSRGSASQTTAAAGSASRRETVHMEPFQDTSHPESTDDPADLSNLDTHTPTPRSHGVSVTLSQTDSDLQSALAESQRGIIELKDIVVKKLSGDKPDNPRLDFCDFLKVELVQLTSDSYDEFQQETFNLVMRLKCRDKQQQRYQHAIDTSMAMTVTYSQASTSHQYPLSHTQMQAPQQQMQQTFTHIPQALPQQQHLQHSQHHFQQTFTQAHAPAQQHIHGFHSKACSQSTTCQ